jgi:hypothetical protein
MIVDCGLKNEYHLEWQYEISDKTIRPIGVSNMCLDVSNYNYAGLIAFFSSDVLERMT